MRSVAVAGVILAVLAGAQSLSAQSLAATAAKEKERRSKQKVATPAKNYDSEQLGSVGTLANDTSVPPAEVSGAAGKQGASADAEVSVGSSASAGRGESYWRSRAAELRARVTTAERNLKDAEAAAVRAGPLDHGDYKVPCQKGRVVNPGGTLGPEIDPCVSMGLSQDWVVAAKKRVESARQALADAQRALARFEEEAHRAGALPGWIR